MFNKHKKGHNIIHDVNYKDIKFVRLIKINVYLYI